MQAMRLHKEVEKDGEITLTGLPCKKGQWVELILLVEPQEEAGLPLMTARDLLESGLVGIWKDREDIGDSVGYARQLREEAQHRGR